MAAVAFGAEAGVDVDGTAWEVTDVVGGGVEVMLLIYEVYSFSRWIRIEYVMYGYAVGNFLPTC